MTTTITDSEVIRASLDEPEAFAAIFERHFDDVHAYISRRAGTGAGDEVAGEVFRIAFESRARFDLSYPSARPWLFGIAARHVARWHRSAGRRHRAYERLLTTTSAAADDAYEAVDARVDAASEAQCLGMALDALTEGDREALLLYAWERLSYEEVARALEIPIGTVRSRLFRARRVVDELLRSSGQLAGEHIEKGRHRG